MNRPSRTARRASFVGVAALLTALAPAVPAAAETVPVTVALASGEGAVCGPVHPVQHRRGHELAVAPADRGAGPGMGRHPREPVGEHRSRPGHGRETDSTTLYRRSFVLPAGVGPAEVRLCVLAEGAATVRLNGTVVIEQTSPANIGNHKNPADCYGQLFSQPSLLRPGPNALQFSVPNFTGALGIDFEPT